MATYEVESVFYNNYGGVKTKNIDLFSTKNQSLTVKNKTLIYFRPYTHY